MENIKLIYKYVEPLKVNGKNGCFSIYIRDQYFTSASLVLIISQLKYLCKTRKFLATDIIIRLGRIEFTDKITYLMLDATLYYLFKSYPEFNIYMEIDTGYSINEYGLKSTAFHFSADPNSGKLNQSLFIAHYEKKLFTTLDVYRRVITRKEFSNSIFLSIIASEIHQFFRNRINDIEWVDIATDISSELLCNVKSHSDGDCLIDIDISDLQELETGNCNFIMSNIGVLNFTEILLYDKLKSNIKSRVYNYSDKLYSKVYKAESNHSNCYNDLYEEDHFYMITAFQNHVTSRETKSGSSGTGLTTLIETIYGKTRENFSYVLSGHNGIFFDERYIAMSDDKFIGFNSEKDYINSPPANDTIFKSDLYVPGTIYNLRLIKENCNG